MYFRILEHLCPSLDVRFYPVLSNFPTRLPFSRQIPDRLEDISPTFEDSSATLLIWFSPIFIIEKLGKLEIFKFSKTSVLWFDYLYLLIKIIFTLTYLFSHGWDSRLLWKRVMSSVYSRIWKKWGICPHALKKCRGFSKSVGDYKVMK